MASQSRIKYATTILREIEVPNTNMGDGSVASNISGLASNGNVAYCVKRDNKIDKATIFTINNFATDPAMGTSKIIPYATYGMAYHENYLYIASKNKIVKVSVSGTQMKEFYVEADGKSAGSQALTYYKDGKFILMANTLNEGTDYLCFIIGTFNEASGSFTETDKRFYVKNTGYTSLQDICYDPAYGLLITTNEMVSGAYTTKNLILRTDMKRVDSLHNNCNLYYPVSEYRLEGKTAEYKQLNAESIIIGTDKRMHFVANIVAASSTSVGFKTDGLLAVGNLRFYDDRPFWARIYFNTGVDIPTLTGTIENASYSCGNPGAFAMNGKTAYCLTSHTAKDTKLQDDVSILTSTANVETTAFKKAGGVLRGMGHANGMAYYNGELYVAAYNRKNGQKDVVKLHTNGAKGEKYTCTDIMIGGISHYKNDQFIVLDYTIPYSEDLRFYIGTFTGTEFKSSKSFTVHNRTFVQEHTVLQNIHYEEGIGLYFISRVNKVDTLLRIADEDIDKVSVNDKLKVLTVAEENLCNGTVGKAEEVESVCISDGAMYAVKNIDLADKATKVQTLTFLK